MSLDDRDYMGERREPEPAFLRPRRHRRHAGLRTAALALLCAAVAWGAWRAAERKNDRAGWMATVLRELPAGVRQALRIDHRGFDTAPALPDAATLPQAPERRALTRQELFPGAPDHPTDGSIRYPSQTARSRTVNRCIGASGATAYSDAPCAAGQRGVPVEVRNDINIADGLHPPTPQELAQQRQQEAVDAAQQQAHQQAQAAQRLAWQQQQASSNPQASCVELEAAILRYDAMARAPQYAQTQDWISQKRKEARDAQFRLRCR